MHQLVVLTPEESSDSNASHINIEWVDGERLQEQEFAKFMMDMKKSDERQVTFATPDVKYMDRKNRTL